MQRSMSTVLHKALPTELKITMRASPPFLPVALNCGISSSVSKTCAKLFVANCVSRPCLDARNSFGVVHEVVQRQAELQEGLHEGPDGSQVVQVHAQDYRRATQVLLRPQVCDQSQRFLRVPDCEDYVTAILQQDPRMLQAQAARGTRDDGHFAMAGSEVASAHALFYQLLASDLRVRDDLVQ